MKYRLLAAALAAALATTAACSAAGDAGSDQVTLSITWWGNPARAEATEQAIELFEQKNPGIKVQRSPASFSGYYDKLNTQFAADAAPDIFQDDQVTTYVDQGRLLDLTDRDDLDLSKIDEGFLNQAKVDGRLYEVPAGTSPMALVFRSSILDQAGVEVDSNTSWEEFTEAGRQVQAVLDEGQWAIADSSSQHNHFQVWLRQQGKDWFAEDGSLGFSADDLTRWWAYWQTLRDEGITPPADVTVASAGGDVSKSPIARNLVQLSIYGTSVTLPSEDWSYGALPGEAANPGAYLMRANSWAVNAASKHPDEAVALVNFLINDPEAGKILGMSRGIPPNAEIAEQIVPQLSPKEKQIADYVAYLREPGNSAGAPAPDPAGTRNIRSEMFDRHSQSVMFGKATPEQAALAFVAEAEKA